MDSTTEGKPEMETKPSGPALVYSKSSTDKYAENRMANKQRKKIAHRRKIARSNTNG